LSIDRIRSTAGTGTPGTDIASSQDSSRAVSVCRIAQRICSTTARPGCSFLAFAPVPGRTHFADQTLHSRDGEIDVDGKGCAHVFDHLLALFRFGFEQELIDYVLWKAQEKMEGS
jgi:hypothetical protein